MAVDGRDRLGIVVTNVSDFHGRMPSHRRRPPSTAGEFSTLFELFVLAAARRDPGDEVPLVADRQQQHGGYDDGNADLGARAILPERQRDPASAK